MGRLDNKTALVTGAGSGFGEAIAILFACEGCKVLIADINTSAAERVASSINNSSTSASTASTARAIPVTFGCTSLSSWTAALGVAKSQCNGLDIVVNNAGTTYKKKDSTTVTEEEFDKVVNVNIKSIFLSVKVVGPYFIEKKSGVFLNTSSVSGTRTRPGMVWYGGTKGFVNTVCIFLFIPFTLLHSPH
jgi:3-oxoacyl-[acyl-carrier protein] reductase